MGQLLKQSHILRFTGYAPFLIKHKINNIWSASVAVQCRLGNQEKIETALLDTGAEWSVIGKETAITLELGTSTESFYMSTRNGRISGSLYRINITLLAKENCGYDLTVESSAFISEEWDGPIVLGYMGFLERIRFALDPGINAEEQFFYFGTV